MPEPTIYRIWGEHVNNYTTEVIKTTRKQNY